MAGNPMGLDMRSSFHWFWFIGSVLQDENSFLSLSKKMKKKKNLPSGLLPTQRASREPSSSGPLERRTAGFARPEQGNLRHRHAEPLSSSYTTGGSTSWWCSVSHPNPPTPLSKRPLVRSQSAVAYQAPPLPTSRTITVTEFVAA